MRKDYKNLAQKVIETALKEDINYLWSEDGKFWSKLI